MENSSLSTTLQDSPIVFPPNGFRWFATLPFIVGALVLFFLAVIAGGVWYTLANHLDLASARAALSGMPAVNIQSVAEVFVIAYIVLLLPGLAHTSLANIGFRRISAQQLGTIVLAAILMFVIVTPLATLIQNALHFKTPEQAIAMFSRTSGWQRVLFVFFGAVLAPAFEEAVFRLVLFNAMRKWWGFWPGAIVSSILFGLAHAQPPFTLAMWASITLPLAVGGLILCGVYAKTNNAWASPITHGLFNGFSLVLLALFPQLAK